MPGRRSAEEIFGEVLREVRLERGLSQEELALACDRHRTYISLLERGVNSPSLRTILQLADALGVRPSDLLRRIEKHV
ncbi:MAG: helix-turn-helix domain-containing protein [Actinomycetota bacterium]